MLIFFRLVAIIVAFWAIESAQNTTLIGLYVFLSVLFQWFLTVCNRISKSYQIDREVLHVLRSSNKWFTARDIAERIVKMRLERELESGKLRWSGYRKREAHLLKYELTPQVLSRSLMTLLRIGDAEHSDCLFLQPLFCLWRQAQCSPTRGPWGRRLVQGEPEGG